MIAITIIYWFIPSNDSHILPTIARSSSSATSFYAFSFSFFCLVANSKETSKKINLLCFFSDVKTKTKNKTLENQIRTQETRQKK